MMSYKSYFLIWLVKILYAVWSVLTYDPLKDKCIDEITIHNIVLFYLIKQT